MTQIWCVVNHHFAFVMFMDLFSFDIPDCGIFFQNICNGIQIPDIMLLEVFSYSQCS